MCLSTLLHLDRDQKILLLRGFPIRTRTGQRFIGSSPYFFVALTVLHRQYVPRHPPRALSRLSFNSRAQKMNLVRRLHSPLHSSPIRRSLKLFFNSFHHFSDEIYKLKLPFSSKSFLDPSIRPNSFLWIQLRRAGLIQIFLRVPDFSFTINQKYIELKYSAFNSFLSKFPQQFLIHESVISLNNRYKSRLKRLSHFIIRTNFTILFSKISHLHTNPAKPNL